MSRNMTELRERFGATLEASETIQSAADAEDRDMSVEEQAQYDALLDEHDKLDADIQRRERLDSRKAAIQKAERKSTPQVPETRHVETATRITVPHYAGTLRAFKTRKGETDREAEKRAYEAGKWLAGYVFGHQSARLWCVEHGIQTRAQEEGVNTKGGALVPNQISDAIIDLREEYGVARQNANVVDMDRDHLIRPRRTGGVDAYAVGEGASITESEKDWDQVTLTARKWGCLVKYSAELSDDAIISIADDLASEMGYAFAIKEDDAMWNGDGTITYHNCVGILTRMLDGNHTQSYYLAPGAGNSMDVMGEVTTAALSGLIGQLPAYAGMRGQLKWYCPVAAVGLIFQRLLAGAGGNTKTDLAGGLGMSFLGYPVVPVPAWAGTGATDFSALIMVMLGDLRQAAMLGSRRQTRIKVTSDLYAASDQLGIIGTTRFDVNVHDIGDTTVAGPLVGLKGN